jgi:glutamine synthetase
LPGFQAPSKLFFSQGNRSAAVRIPAYATGEKEKRIEFRPPDATCNIYYALAAQLLAGLDGMSKAMQPDPFGPIEGDAGHMTGEKRKALEDLPACLEQAIGCLRRDQDFLIQGEVFTRNLIESWIAYKVRRELIPLQQRPHPYEFTLYYDV